MSRRKRSDDGSDIFFGALILIGVVLAPFYFLYIYFGWLGLSVVCLGIPIALYKVSQSRKGRKQEQFERLLIARLTERGSIEEEQRLVQSMLRGNAGDPFVFRSVQLIGDSAAIALSSQKPDTANSRMNLVLAQRQKINEEFHSRISDNALAQINEFVDNTLKLFPVALCTNQVQGHLKKARSLKTAKGRRKYLRLSRDLIEQEFLLDRIERDILFRLLEEVSAAEKIADECL